MLACGGFVIRQWASNDERIINLEANTLHANFTLNADRALKTLGIIWNTQNDEICYSINSIKRLNNKAKYFIGNRENFRSNRLIRSGHFICQETNAKRGDLEFIGTNLSHKRWNGWNSRIK